MLIESAVQAHARTRLRYRALALCSCLILALPACGARRAIPPDAEACSASRAALSSPAKDGALPFDVASDPHFAGYEAALREYLLQETDLAETRFCVIGFVDPQQGERDVSVLWPEGSRLFAWEGGESKLANAKQIDLKKDVVASEDEIRGSTYLVTREWLERLVSACHCYGRTLRVVRFRK